MFYFLQHEITVNPLNSIWIKGNECYVDLISMCTLNTRYLSDDKSRLRKKTEILENDDNDIKMDQANELHMSSTSTIN